MKNQLFTLVLFFFPAFLLACSCSYITNFCETMTPSSNVLGVEVTQSYLSTTNDGLVIQYVDVRVKDRLQGDISAPFLSLLVSDGTSCTQPPFLILYQPGDLLFVIADRMVEDSPSGFPTYHAFSGCATYLTFADNGPGSVDYEDFIKNISECSLTTRAFDKEELDRLIQFTPNPATSDLKIFSSVPLPVEATVYAADGRIVQTFNLEQSQFFTTNVADWPSGVYFVHLATAETSVTKRLLKM